MQVSVYYHPLCPFSKQVITLLGELGCKYNLVKEDYWLSRPAFIDLSPWGELPVMIVNDEIIIAGAYPCIEYLIDVNKSYHLFSEDFEILSRIRQVVNWFNKHFYYDVSKNILDEKLVKMDLKTSYPDTNVLRKAKTELHKNLMKLNTIISLQEYLAYDSLSFADISAASHLAVLDYFQEINWPNYPKVKYWYCLIKSRPSFRATLHEKIKTLNPPKHYLELDF